MTARSLFLVFALLFCRTGASQEASRSIATAQLPNGLFVGFTTTKATGLGTFGGFSGTDLMYRLFTDRSAGLFFGYNVSFAPLTGSKRILVTVTPFDPAALRGQAAERLGKAIEGLSALPLPRYPAPQVIDDGDVIALEVLENRHTGEKVIDRIRVSADQRQLDAWTRPASSGTPRDFSVEQVQLQMTNATLFVNGTQTRARGGCTGTIVGFSLDGIGRFFFSLVPREGYAFLKIGVIDRAKLSFTYDGDQYEWISSSDIVGDNGVWNVWVLRDAAFRPESPIDFGFWAGDSMAGLLQYRMQRR